MARLTERNIIKIIVNRLLFLVKLPIFWIVTFLGNGFVLAGALTLFYLEKDLHSKAISILDCLGWSVGLVTTIGYADLIPISSQGKILGILMMTGGTLFLWSYMALLVGALFAPEISLIEKEIKGIKKETDLDNKKIDELISKIEKVHQLVENMQSKSNTTGDVGK